MTIGRLHHPHCAGQSRGPRRLPIGSRWIRIRKPDPTVSYTARAGIRLQWSTGAGVTEIHCQLAVFLAKQLFSGKTPRWIKEPGRLLPVSFSTQLTPASLRQTSWRAGNLKIKDYIFITMSSQSLVSDQKLFFYNK